MSQEIKLTLFVVADGAMVHVALHRSIDADGTRHRDDLWTSERMHDIDLADIEPDVRRSEQWRDVLLGLAVKKIAVASAPNPLTLTLREGSDPRLSEFLDGPRGAVQALFAVSLRLEEIDGDGSIRVRSGNMDQAERNPFTDVFLPAARAAVEELGLSRVTDGRDGASAVAIVRRPDSMRGSRRADRADVGDVFQCPGEALTVAVRDVRGMQIGDHNRQVNRFIVHRPDRSLDFRSVLKDSRVREAMTRLAVDPMNKDCRGELMTALRNVPGNDVRSAPLVLQARDNQPGLWGRLITFDEVKGLQIGDRNTQHNTFRYTVMGEPTAAALLRGNPALARAVTEYICPPTGRTDVEKLRQNVAETLRNLPDSVDRTRGAAFSYPRAGVTLTIVRSDGVTVGTRNRMDNKFTRETEVARSTVRADLRQLRDRAEAARVEAARNDAIRADAIRADAIRADVGREDADWVGRAKMDYGRAPGISSRFG